MEYVIAAYAVTIVPLLLYGRRLAMERRQLRAAPPASGGLTTEQSDGSQD